MIHRSSILSGYNLVLIGYEKERERKRKNEKDSEGEHKPRSFNNFLRAPFRWWDDSFDELIAWGKLVFKWK